MTIPLVSVIIPTFNRKDLIRGAIQNVLAQTYQNLELIIVEDGSNTGIDEYIKSLGNDKIIYKRHNNNFGLGVSRNTGMNVAKGDYIAFMDDDDRWLKEKIKLQLDILTNCENKKTMIYCYKKINNANILSRKHKKSNIRGLMLNHIFRGSLIPSSSMMIPKDLLIDLGGHSENLKSCVDHDLWMKLAINDFNMDLVEEELVYSVNHDNQRMVDNFDDRLIGIKQFFNKWQLKVIHEYGNDTWIQIEKKYHIQTSYGIVNCYRKKIICKEMATYYLKNLFLLQSIKFSWFDLLIAKFGLRFSTKLFRIIPLKKLLFKN